MTVVTFTTAGTFTWTAPAGVTSVKAECWGGGGGGAGSFSTNTRGGGGGGGGEYAAELTLAVTPGNSYSYTVGAAGAAGLATGPGGTAGLSSFAGDSVTVTAHAGSGGAGSTGTSNAGGAGGTGSANGTHFTGGTGGTGTSGTGSGGGGGSGGTGAGGNNGGTGAASGAAAVTGGGPGGTGSGTTSTAGSAPSSGPGGGGGGGYRTTASTAGGAGFAGQVQLTYTVSPTTVAGPAADVTAAAPAGTVITTVTVAGPVADTAVAALAGTASGATVIAGPAANVAVAALPGVAGGASVTVAGPAANVAANALAGSVIAVSGGPVSAPAERASLLIDSQIELLQGGVQSAIPACYGAIFMLDQGYDLGVPVPVIDIVGELVRDGEILIGDRASNRTLTLPIVIQVPPTGDLNADLATLAGARETLVQITNKQRWTLTWTRDGGYPLVYDCSRAAQPSPKYSVRQDRQILTANISITFQAQPYGRSSLPEQLSFASPVSGSPAPPPPPVPLDDYESVSGTHWSASSAHITGSSSAHWAAPAATNAGPTYTSLFSPAKDITGRGVLQFWAGFASSRYAWLWGRSASPVAFTCTLWDSAARTLTFGASASVVQSSVITSPNWYQVSAGIPSPAAFDFAHVTRCDILTTNFYGTNLSYTDVFLDDLSAQPSTTTTPASVRGSLVTLRTKGTSHAPLSLQFEQPPALLPSTFTLSGSGTFGPIPAGVTSINVACTGGGGAGAGLTTTGHGGGGGGGAFAQESSLDVTPGRSYSYSAGAGGTQGASPVNGGASSFTGDSVTVLAAGGHSAAQNSSTGGAGGAAGSNAVAFAGGSGATPSTTGGGGGAAASATGAGASGSGVTGGTGPSGSGGNGGASGTAPGAAGTSPGGGGGGATSTSGAAIGGAGAAGTIVVTYTVQQPPFKTLIAHRPGPESPASLTPFVSVANVTDPPDGRQYPVVSRIPGLNARFQGTYTIIGVANSFSSPASPRTAYVTVWQTDFPGGPATSQSTIPRTFTPATDISNGIVVLGELTLPGRDVPPDNTSMFHALGITDSNLGDSWLDFLLIDALGALVIINTAVPQAVFYIDEADSTRDIGRVMGSNLDRTQAVSVLADTFVSGGGLTVDPGDNPLLVYSTAGAPSIACTYSPRYFLDRI